MRDEFKNKSKNNNILPIPLYLTKLENEDMNFDVNHSGLNIILMNSRVTSINLNGVNKEKKRSKSLDTSKPEPKKKNARNNKKKSYNKPKYVLPESEVQELFESLTELNKTTDVIQEISEDDTEYN